MFTGGSCEQLRVVPHTTTYQATFQPPRSNFAVGKMFQTQIYLTHADRVLGGYFQRASANGRDLLLPDWPRTRPFETPAGMEARVIYGEIYQIEQESLYIHFTPPASWLEGATSRVIRLRFEYQLVSSIYAPWDASIVASSLGVAETTITLFATQDAADRAEAAANNPDPGPDPDPDPDRDPDPIDDWPSSPSIPPALIGGIISGVIGLICVGVFLKRTCSRHAAMHRTVCPHTHNYMHSHPPPVAFASPPAAGHHHHHDQR